MAQLYFLDFAVISVTTRKTESYAIRKKVLGKVCLNFLNQIIVNNLLS